MHNFSHATVLRVLLVLSSCFVGLHGCVSTHVEVEQIGVMQFRRYWMQDHIKWESNIWVGKEEVCPPSGKDCISSEQLFHEAYKDLLWVAIAGQNKPRKMYFFNTKTGAQIPCAQCSTLLTQWGYGSSFWLEGGRFLTFTWNKRAAESGLLMAQLNTATNAFELRVLKSRNFDSGHGTSYGYSTSPTKDNFAWYECGPKCTLYWLSPDYTRLLSEGTECATDRLEIYWENGRPMNGHSAGTGSKSGCRDVNGKLRFPLQPFYKNGVPTPSPPDGEL
jgi:hypothetical protein